MHRFKVPLAAACAMAAALFCTPASGQIAPLSSRQAPIALDSGPVSHPGDPAVDAGSPQVVFAADVHIPGATWLRLNFDEATLSGDAGAGSGSYLVVTSVLDGASQRLDAASVRDWNYTSAYFNGDTVIVEMYAYPATGPSRLVMSEVTAGEPQPESICGTTDDRLPSNDARQGRLVPIGCTAWLIERGDCGNRFLTAGHCIANSTSNAVVQFNVPFSNANGSLNHPPPQHQYSVPAGQIQSNGGAGVGNDYATFFSAVNGNTGLTPRQAQGGGAYRLAAAAPPAAGQVRIAGYGVRDGSAPIPFEWNQIQKIHAGPYTDKSGTSIRYTVDTTGGNSGSPVVDTATGLAIGIHTHGGCTSTGGSNAGTAIEIAGLQNFLNSPTGTCIPMDNGALSTIFASNNGGSVGGAVYFDLTVKGRPIRVNGMQLNTTSTFGTNFTLEVFTTPGTSVGKQSDPSAWTSRSTGSGVSGHREAATRVTLNTPFQLDANTSYGIAIVLTDAAHAYTNGTGSNQSYSNAEIQLNLGSATNVPFSGTPFDPRVWNGTVMYEVIDSSSNNPPFAFSIRSNVDHRLYRINLMTGEATPMGGPMAFTDAEGMAMGPNGTIYAIGGTVGELWNVTSPPGAKIGDTGPRSGIDAGLDFYNGVLYNMNGASGSSTLYRVNPATGAAAAVGTTNVFLDGLAIRHDGAAYGVDWIFSDSLYRVNINTGATALVGPLGLGNVSAQAGLSFIGDALWAITSTGEIYHLDTATGAATQVAEVTIAGSKAGGWEGLAIAPNSAASLMGLEPFASTFSSASLTRGYWFRAPTDLLINGLRVPDEAGEGVQNVEVVRFNSGAPPAFPTTTNDFVSLFRAVGVQDNSVIPTNIPVRAGDVIGILGAAGTSTMRNSYATANEFNTSIAGQPVTIKRMGMQFNLNTTPAQQIWTENVSPVSRVEMYYIMPPSLYLDADTAATGSNLVTSPLNTPLGQVRFLNGELVTFTSDLEFNRAGSAGNRFDIVSTTTPARLEFDFDADSVTFVYGGNLGGIRVEALNAAGAVIDAFEQADTFTGQPAGPRTLAAAGIRAIRWNDTSPGSAFAALDNITFNAGASACYPDCDGNNQLDFFDFLCFQNAFLNRDPYADCDGNRTFDFFDFLCFQNAFLAGCP
jgi:V8-like Glu-specific endopeptidase